MVVTARPQIPTEEGCVSVTRSTAQGGGGSFKNRKLIKGSLVANFRYTNFWVAGEE